MSLFGVRLPGLGKDVRSEHFSNEELQKLYAMFCLGNSLDDPSKIADIAERIYSFPTWEELVKDALVRDLYVSGAGPVVAAAFTAKKR